VTTQATEIVQSATEKEKFWQTSSPVPSWFSDMKHLVPRAVVAASAKYVAAWEKSKWGGEG